MIQSDESDSDRKENANIAKGPSNIKTGEKRNRMIG